MTGNVIRVMLWDVRVGGNRRLPLIERVDADIVLLLGVSRASGRAWSERWTGDYFTVAGLSLADSPQQRPHGAMIASRWELSDTTVLEQLPRPERGLSAVVSHPAGPLRVLSWGTPNAAGDSRPVKQSAYRIMNDHLRSLTGPVIVGVDTNTWGDPPTPEAKGPIDPDWADEHRFIARDADHGLTDVYRELVDRDPHRARLLQHLRPAGPLDVTFIRRPHGRSRAIARGIGAGEAFGLDRMDRIYVSSDVIPLACEHLYHEAIDAGGDHAAVVADLEITWPA